jgi:hypothetical protein
MIQEFPARSRRCGLPGQPSGSTTIWANAPIFGPGLTARVATHSLVDADKLCDAVIRR